MAHVRDVLHSHRCCMWKVCKADGLCVHHRPHESIVVCCWKIRCNDRTFYCPVAQKKVLCVPVMVAGG